MKLIDVTWQHRFDFRGILQCEHCEHTQSMDHGYDDANFHNNVIPAIVCIQCGKRRTEETLSKISDPSTQGGVTVRKVEVKVNKWVQDE